MRVVLDTNVIISASLWEDSVAQKLVIKFVNSGFSIFTSPEILEEYQRVLYRDFGLSIEDISWVLNHILPIFRIIKTTERIDVVKADPSDNKIIECALAASVAYIITYDRHLLDIKEFRGIRIMEPEEALRLLG